MKIAVASGKGGTGKTTVSVNLASVFDRPVQLVDCDVEEPNVHLFLSGRNERTEAVMAWVPEIDATLCEHCGECARFCEFNALAALPTITLVFPELCHSCGGCMRVCPEGAITEVKRDVGKVNESQAGFIRLLEGRLNVGEAMAPPIIRAVRAQVDPSLPVILDAPPGTSCSAVATLSDVDFAVLVTEPTPFGLNDLKLAVDLVRQINLPFGVVINRAGIGDERVQQWCDENKVEVLLSIPNDRRIAHAYSRGVMMVDALPEYRVLFKGLRDHLSQRIDRIKQAGC